ncbi:transposase [Bradyrhizobium sp. USDA 4354]
MLRKRPGRRRCRSFFAKLPLTVVVIEACGAHSPLARELGALGHTIKLIAPQSAKPYVPRKERRARCERAMRDGKPAADAVCADPTKSPRCTDMKSLGDSETMSPTSPI